MGRSIRVRIAAAIVGAGLMGLVSAPDAAGGDHEHTHHQPLLEPRAARPHTHETAGYPLCVSPLAHPSNTDRYRGGYVGGGTPHGGHGRRAQEGTWGWDYVGLRPHGSRIFNGWSHGHRYQGGYGRYETDGPRPLEHVTEAIHGHARRD